MGLKNGLFNIPLLVMLCTTVFIMIPPLQNIFMVKGSILNLTIISVNVLVGKSYNFLCMFLLGLFVSESLHIGVERESQGRPTENNFLTVLDIVWLTSLKLILMPLIVLPILLLVYQNIMQVDIVIFYLIFILSASPIDLNMNVICGYKSVFVESCCILTFFMFVFSMITYAIQSTLGLYTLEYFLGKTLADIEKLRDVLINARKRR